jgi:UrcA family protein
MGVSHQFTEGEDVMTRSTKMLLLGSLAGLAAGFAGAAQAGPEPQSTVVRYNNDALESDAGARALYHRLARAAEQVCPNANPHLVTAAVQKCRDEALAGAVGKVNNSRLAAVYAANQKSSGG